MVESNELLCAKINDDIERLSNINNDINNIQINKSEDTNIYNKKIAEMMMLYSDIVNNIGKFDILDTNMSDKIANIKKILTNFRTPE